MRMYISVISSSYNHIAGKLNVENVFGAILSHL